LLVGLLPFLALEEAWAVSAVSKASLHADEGEMFLGIDCWGFSALPIDFFRDESGEVSVSTDNDCSSLGCESL
jgi:hypothetical protein